jgi:hypothetical protein
LEHIERNIFARQLQGHGFGQRIIIGQRRIKRLARHISAAERINRDIAIERGIDQQGNVAVIGPGQIKRGVEPGPHTGIATGFDKNGTHADLLLRRPCEPDSQVAP